MNSVVSEGWRARRSSKSWYTPRSTSASWTVKLWMVAVRAMGRSLQGCLGAWLAAGAGMLAMGAGFPRWGAAAWMARMGRPEGGTAGAGRRSPHAVSLLRDHSASGSDG